MRVQEYKQDKKHKSNSLMGNFFTTVKEASRLWKEMDNFFRMKRKRRNLRLSIPDHPSNCLCPTCLYACDRILRPHSRLKIERFFQAYLLERAKEKKGPSCSYRWKNVETLLNFLEHWEKNPSFTLACRDDSWFPRYRQRICEAIAYRATLNGLFSSPQWLFNSSLRGTLCAISKIISADDVAINRIIRYCPKEGISLRDLLRRSNIDLKEFHRLIQVYDGEVGLMIGKGRRQDQIMVYPTHIPPKKHPLHSILIGKKKNTPGRVNIFSPV